MKQPSPKLQLKTCIGAAAQFGRAPAYALVAPQLSSTPDARITRHAWRTGYTSRLPGGVRVQTCAYFFDPCASGGAAAGGHRPSATSGVAQLGHASTRQHRRLLDCDININPLTADWIWSGLAHQLRGRRSVRGVLNNAISALQCVLRRPGGPRILVGVRLMASGRLGRQKKGLAQRITRTIGRLPASSWRRKVELCQDFVVGPLGSVGLKVWVCYA